MACQNPRFPGNLQMSDRQLDEAGESDVNNFFQLTVEMFDYLECELNLFQTVFNSLDMSRSVSVTTAGQCRLAPLIQVILDCSHLYDYTVKLLFKLHSCLPADTLQGHRDRFMEQFTKLKDLFYRSSNLQYFKRLIQIPQLPDNPPNFLRASALSEHISPVVVIPAEASSPDSEPVLEKDDLMDMDASQQNSYDSKFDDIFGSSSSSDPFNFNSQNGVNKDEKDHLIDQLYGEISGLKAQLENMKTEITYSPRSGLFPAASSNWKNAGASIWPAQKELLPRGLDIKQEELGDLVDKEMAATSAAIETATARIEEMLSKSRAGDTGVKLEVNERILGSCTSLMQAIQVLIVASKELQREIVESGR
ncbi:Huntingtin-interacting protein 1, partial [Eschrichtius robustus]|nr:Huntingtin-interacting protein 1 [Eschrichtius robustus]